MNALDRSFQLAKLAKDIAKVKTSHSDEAKKNARTHLVDRLCALHGIPQKIGQILSLTELKDSDKPFTQSTEFHGLLSFETIKATIEKNLKKPLSACFKNVEEQGISASLGQVHKATLLDGRPAAIKIQYPGIEDSLNYDLKALGWLTLPVGGLNNGFDLTDYKKEIGSMLQEEIDYDHEMRMMKKFSASIKNWPSVHIPEVIDSLSNKKILTMTWVEGQPFSDTLQWSQADRKKLAEQLLTLFLTSIFQWNTIHSDPHPGNYRFSRKNGAVTIGLLDFGCVKELQPKQVMALAGLITDINEKRNTGSMNHYLSRFLELGFDQNLLVPMAHLLEPLCGVLFEPFQANRAFSLKDWNLGGRVGELLGDFRMNFRIAGPANLIFFMRAYQGLIQYLKALEVEVNWADIFKTARGSLSAQPASPMAALASKNPNIKSESLRIHVRENNKDKVSITMKPEATENLADLVPDDVKIKLREKNINIQTIAKNAVQNDFEPMELFHLKDGEKTIRVWLE